jgi:hypothetical protein
MQVTFELSDEVAEILSEAGDISRQALEAFTAAAYRQGSLTRHQVGQVLCLDYWQTDELLTKYDAHRPFTLAEYELDMKCKLP